MASPLLAPLVKSKLKARSAAKGLSSLELERVITNLQQVLKTEVAREEAKEAAARKAKIAKIRALMEESGLSASDLKAVKGRRGRRKGAGKAKVKGKVAPKYRLVVAGEEHLWTGRGRPPKVFKAYLDSGKSKDSCLIK
ncbi:MAG: H-NS histone family protein [Pseudomonadota bacterium]